MAFWSRYGDTHLPDGTLVFPDSGFFSTVTWRCFVGGNDGTDLGNKIFILPSISTVSTVVTRWLVGVNSGRSISCEDRICYCGGDDGFPLQFGPLPPLCYVGWTSGASVSPLSLFGGWDLGYVDLPATMASTISSLGHWFDKTMALRTSRPRSTMTSWLGRWRGSSGGASNPLREL